MERRRHISPKRGVKRSSAWTALIVIVSLLLIACVVVLSPAGVFLLNEVIIPVYGCITGPGEDQAIVSTLEQQDESLNRATPQPSPSQKAREVVNVEETPFYILQMGAFTDETKAKEHADEIRRLGAAGVVYPEGSVYRVFAAAYPDESSLMKVQGQVRDDGFEATPYITEIRALKITLDGDAQAVASVKAAVKLMSEVPTELCAAALAYDKNELDAEKLLNRVQSLHESCSAAVRSFDPIGDASVKPIADLAEQYAEKLSTFLKEHDTIHTEMLSGDLKHLQVSIIIDYILFFDRK